MVILGPEHLSRRLHPALLARYGHITTQENRYITIDGCVRKFCPAHGML